MDHQIVSESKPRDSIVGPWRFQEVFAFQSTESMYIYQPEKRPQLTMDIA